MNTIDKRIEALEQRIDKLESIILKNQNTVHSSPKSKKISIKEFILEKNPRKDVQKTLLVAYYLEKFENMQSVNVQDLENYFRQAKETPPKNINACVNRNINQGYMMEDKSQKDSHKAWLVTNTGEKFIENGFKKAEI